MNETEQGEYAESRAITLRAVEILKRNVIPSHHPRVAAAWTAMVTALPEHVRNARISDPIAIGVTVATLYAALEAEHDYATMEVSR